MKRIISLLLALVLVVGMLPLSVFAAELAITQQPKSVKVLEGQTAKVTLKATGDDLTYKWYYKNPGDSGYSYTSSFKGNSYSITMNESRNGRYVYCKVYDGDGNYVKSNTVSLRMAEPVTITAQPKSIAVASGETAKVTVTAKGDSLTYKWYYKNAGDEDFSYTSSFKSNSYSVTMNADRAGRQVYCEITDKYGATAKSDIATLNMATELKITKQPADVAVSAGATAKVTVTAQGDGLTYKWYYANPGSDSFKYTSSFNGNTYSVAMTEARNGRRVYCEITDKYGKTVTSKTVTLSLRGEVKITQQPKSVKVAEGEKATVSFTATGEGLKYEWYYKNPGETKYSKTTAFIGNTYSVTMNAERNGRYVYCYVTDKYGNTTRTNTVSLRMLEEAESDPLTVKTQPKTQESNAGGVILFSAAATGGKEPYTYQWQYTNDNLAAYKNFTTSDSSWASGYTGPTLRVEVSESDFTYHYQYQCVITDANGDSVTTEPACVKKAFTIKTQPENVIGAVGDTVSFTIKAEGGTEPYTYQWQQSYYGSGWSNMTGKTKSTLSFTVSDSREFDDEYCYRCIVTDAAGTSLISNTVRVETGELKITRHPATQDATLGTKVQLTVAVSGGSEPYTYQWQFINSSHDDYVSITSQHNWASGWNTATLSFTLSRTDITGQWHYRCIITDADGNSVTSNAAGFRVPLELTNQPTDVYAPIGSYVSFSVEVFGGTPPYSYKWEYTNDNMSYYLALSGGTGSTYTKTITKGDVEDHWLYRCVITDAAGNKVTTDPVAITAPLALYGQSSHRYTTAGTKVSFFVTPMGGKQPYSYQWQFINDNHEEFVDITADHSWGKNPTTNTLTITASQTDFDLHYRYRCRITDANGEEIYSEPVAVYNYMAVSIPIWVATPFGGTIEFEGKVVGGVGPYTYEWQYKETEATDYQKIPEGTFSGVNTNKLKFELTPALWAKSYDFRLKVTDSNGRSEFSNVAHAYHLEY